MPAIIACSKLNKKSADSVCAFAINRRDYLSDCSRAIAR